MDGAGAARARDPGGQHIEAGLARNVLMPDGTRKAEAMVDHAYLPFRRLKGDAAPLPDYFVDAQSLGPEDHLAVQARVQVFVDSSISKTINCPEEMEFENFKDVYMRVYELGCKGCTTYRPNEVTGAVLESAGAGQARSRGAGNNKLAKLFTDKLRSSWVTAHHAAFIWKVNSHRTALTN